MTAAERALVCALRETWSLRYPWDFIQEASRYYASPDRENMRRRLRAKDSKKIQELVQGIRVLRAHTAEVAR